jgi:hypothetical protein
LAWIADGLPRTPDAEGYRRLFTQAANHLLPLAHPPNDLRHAINSRRDARSSINSSRERRHENEIRRREEYDRDHGIPARSQATRTESATASTGGTTRGRSRYHDNHSPPRERHHHRGGLVKRSTLPDRPPLTPEEDLVEANARWTTSSMPSARTTRTCATPYGIAETSSTPWGTADPSNLYLLPRCEEDQESRDSPSSRRRWSLPAR